MNTKRIVIAIIVLSCSLNCVYGSSNGEGEMIVDGAKSVLGDFIEAAQSREQVKEDSEGVASLSLIDPSEVATLLSKGQIVKCSQLLAKEETGSDLRKLLRIQILNRLNCLLVKVECGLRQRNKSKWDGVDVLWLGRDNLESLSGAKSWPCAEETLAKAIVLCERNYGKMTHQGQKRVLLGVAVVFQCLFRSLNEYTEAQRAHFDYQFGRIYLATAIRHTLPIYKNLAEKQTKVTRQFKSVSLNGDKDSFLAIRKRLSSLWKEHKSGGCSFKKAVKLVKGALSEMESYLAAIRLHKEAYSI